MKDVDLIFKFTRKVEYGYTTDYIYIAEYSRSDAEERLAGTVDNKDGYGNVQAAELMGRIYKALLEAGHKHFYDYSIRSHSLTTRHQVYQNPEAERPSYCQPVLELSSAYEGVKWGLKLIERLGKLIEKKRVREYKLAHDYECYPAAVGDRSLEQVQDVLWALRKIGAVETRDWRAPNYGPYPAHFQIPV